MDCRRKKTVVWSVSFLWLNTIDEKNETNQVNPRDPEEISHGLLGPTT
jgi:hypothetical protein